MIKNLINNFETSIYRKVSVCIVGAGTAGIYLAKQLRDHGISVLILEAGNHSSKSPKDLGKKTYQNGVLFRGAESGRSFGLGGTSTMWGGQMISLTPNDIGDRISLDIKEWPIKYKELSQYILKVKAVLGLPINTENYEINLISRFFAKLETLGGDFELRLSQWIPFYKRNFAKAFASILKKDPGLEVWLNAEVVKLHKSTSTENSIGKIETIEARSVNGNEIRVEADIFVIAAGALESTRLLLEFDDQTDGLLTKNGSPIGRFFSDHLSITCGGFKFFEGNKAKQIISPIFQKGIMRTLRLELTAQAQKKLGIASAFAHFIFTTKDETGFDVVRKILKMKQGQNTQLNLSFKKIGYLIFDLFVMLYWKIIHKRLWIPPLADIKLQIDIEQLPNSESALRLNNVVDSFGRKCLIVDWKISESDKNTIKIVAKHFLSCWYESSMRKIAKLELNLENKLDSFESIYDVYHPTGSLRMGKQECNSVVDPNLRVWSIDNLFVTSTSVFPSAGSANPGLIHLSLTHRLADHLKCQYFQ